MHYLTFILYQVLGELSNSLIVGGCIGFDSGVPRSFQILNLSLITFTLSLQISIEELTLIELINLDPQIPVEPLNLI